VIYPSKARDTLSEYIPPEIRGKNLLKRIEIGSQHPKDKSILLKFYLHTPGELEKVASEIARDETTGKWIGSGKSSPLYEQCVADVDKIEVYGKREAIIYLHSPLINVDQSSDILYQLLMLAVGGPVLEFVYYDRVALLDIELPPGLISKFPGPKFGMNGLRELIGLENKEPIIGTIVKPCAGLSPDEVSKKCYQAALGGATFIKDDEKMLGSEYCPQKEKITKVSQALKQAYEKTGKKCIYAPHLIARADKLKEQAKRFIDWGASGLMFNTVLGHTPEALMLLAEDSDINVPLYAHSGGRSGLSTGPRRIDDSVVVKLIRYCGADFFQHGVFGVKAKGHVASQDESLLLQLVKVMRKDTPGIKDMIPVAAGGMGAFTIGNNLKKHWEEKLGYGVAALAGTHILDHPDGPQAGAQAMYQAAEAYYKEEIVEEERLKSYAQEQGFKELLKIL